MSRARGGRGRARPPPAVDEVGEPVGVRVEAELRGEDGGEADVEQVDGFVRVRPALRLGDDCDEVLRAARGRLLSRARHGMLEEMVRQCCVSALSGLDCSLGWIPQRWPEQILL